MIQRLGRKKFNIYAFDIETHNDIESIEKNESSMWLGCLINDESNIDSEDSYLYDMDSFIDKLNTLSSPKRKHNENRPCKNICIYVYNLSFEWSFILPVLIEKGFQFSETIDEDSQYCYNTISTKSVSSVWQIQIKFTAKSGLIVFRDLAKLYGGGLGNVAKAFNLPTQKGEIDYRLNRLHNYQVTKEEKEYCFKDTRIIIDILLIMQSKNDKDFWNSISMASYSMKKLIKFGFPRSYKPYSEYRKLYPQLNKEETEFLRHSVSGGITYAPARWQFKEINQKVCHIDAHSMHPSSAYFHKFPYGEGELLNGRPKDYANFINCCHIKVSYSEVKLHSVIELIGIPFIEDYELWIWDFEIETMKKAYVNLHIEYIDYYRYHFKPLPWRKFYEWCFNERLKAKANKDEFNKLYYKLLMNSSYGKSLEKAHTTFFENIIRFDGIIDSKINEKIKPSYLDNDEWSLRCLNSKYTYLPYGSCIPAYSRCCLIELALKIGWKDIVYFDTDSIFFIWNEETEANFNKYVNQVNFLGGWAIEEFIDRSQFTAPKRYKTETNGIATFKMGGFNLKNIIEKKAKELNIEENDVNIPFDEINIISNKLQVQRAFRCKGGTLIEFQEKEIQVPKKYLTIYQNNVK